ncbi:MAG TPA: hypothetical protein VF137_09265 [Candidatus Dormibacteraeota bacterium]
MRKAFVAVVAGLITLASGWAIRPAAADDTIRRIGSIDIGTCHLMAWGVDPSLHLLITEQQVQFGQKCGAPTGVTLMLQVFSTSTLRRLAGVPMQPLGGIDSIQVDSVHHRVFILDSSASPAGGDNILVYSISRIQTGTAPLAPDATISIPSTALGLGGASAVGPNNITGAPGDFSLRISGSAYDVPTNQLYLMLYENFGGVNALTSQNGPGADDVYIADVDLASQSLRWAQVLDSCVYDTSTTSLYHVNLGDPILVRHSRFGTEVDAGCIYSRSPSLVPSAQTLGLGASSGLVSGSMMTFRIPLDSTGAPVSGSITFSIGRTHTYGGLSDPEDGRIFWAAAPVNNTQNLSASSSGASAVVYDAAEGVYDGAATISSAAYSSEGFQLAAANHKLYAVGPDGILVLGAANTPPGQGVWFSSYTCATAGLATDAPLNRLLMLPFVGCSATPGVAPDHVVQVYQDNYQLPAAPAAPNPDSYTIQTAERDGATGSQFSGHAEATGTRVRLIGGIHGAVSGATFGLYDSVYGDVPGLPDAVPADYASHEVDLAKASGADLGNYQASAESIAADADAATRAQLKSENGTDWPFQATSCSDPGDRQAQTQYASDTSSTATCQLGSQASTTSAAGPVTVTMYVAGQGQTSQQMALPIGVGANLTSTTVSLVPSQGLVAAASSEVKDVTLTLPNAGELRIDGITLDVSCRAHGRTGTASCTTSRVLNGVTFAGATVSGGSCTMSPGVDTCGQLLAALNRIRPGVLIFQMPDPDQRLDYFNGSPGGYQSIAQREIYEHLQDSVLNYDDSEQIPGLQITYVNDSISEPSRFDVQLGDVEAESHYGITQLGSDCGSCAVAAPPAAPVLSLPTGTPGGHLPAASTPPSLGSALAKIVQRVWAGVQLLLRSPAAAAAAIALLLMLVSPLLMGTRRRRLELLVQEVTS